jgi:hypothetical protein
MLPIYINRNSVLEDKSEEIIWKAIKRRKMLENMKHQEILRI